MGGGNLSTVQARRQTGDNLLRSMISIYPYSVSSLMSNVTRTLKRSSSEKAIAVISSQSDLTSQRKRGLSLATMARGGDPVADLSRVSQWTIARRQMRLPLNSHVHLTIAVVRLSPYCSESCIGKDCTAQDSSFQTSLYSI